MITGKFIFDLYNKSCNVSFLEKLINLGVFIPNYSRIGVIEGIPKSQEVMIGEIVLTSGISDIYPGNIPIAEVISTHIDPNELFQNITVRILADIFNPDYVFIIK